ncbi:ribonuclease HII [Varunaivibrio sulfuroxidans]|uniref:Ribonuclease HII n=1 Tax=Varunaivibrio sulfuroxidans TaxID=1773489 RepID=A0A4R3JEL2_9PROT|nr:ribonuclease HII [Varunaivibrio sulfuroxidans]TCS63546.1 RNase HII [Varunaivibrio sulfuroxidans]WES30309.1 ribonuclease HII [Varunaivibrio sulfuroxidans]
MADFILEEGAWAEGYRRVCGVDEAGRGPWAGPVVAGAVVLDPLTLPGALRLGLDDSKKLTAKKRERLWAVLGEHADIGLGVATVEEIDRLNILQATFLAMRRAVEALSGEPDFALVDGNRVPELPCVARCVVKGDGRSLSIAAASIAAKVNRDAMMTELAQRHPGYGWEKNAGYGVKAHADALRRLGVTPAHRKSFAPIRKMLSPE